jgi:hypothetical protein
MKAQDWHGGVDEKKEPVQKYVLPVPVFDL